jgi:magnesium-transporting ATPase (P-type)
MPRVKPAEAAERLNPALTRCRKRKASRPGCVSAHFNDVLIFVLLAAAALTAVMGHWVDTLVILGVTVINALIGHVQESNAEKSLQGIRNMLSSDARVQRNGKHETLPPATWCRGISLFCAPATAFRRICA